jgi:predicted dehydrogenase
MLRIIQVGMGGWGQNWSQVVFPQVPEVELVACVDANPGALDVAGEAIGIPSERRFTSLQTALEAVECDAVLVTASLAAHIPLAQEALGAGKHVLLEKPFAATHAEAAPIVALAENHGLVLMISQNYRYFPAARTAAALVQSGELGAVGAISIDFRRFTDREPDHPHHRFHHPMLVDMAVHHFDLMRFILQQEARTIVCHAWNPPWSKFNDPASAAATITFDGSTIVSYRGSWVSRGPQTHWAGEWRIECARGEIWWTARGDNQDPSVDQVRLRLIGKRSRRVQLIDLPRTDRAGTLTAFAEAIRTGALPETTGRDNLNTIALMNAAVSSALSGSLISIPATDT